jgi:hypothetical protein
MYYLDFLAAVHGTFAPRTYLEIGVARGHSLSLSGCRSIGIDPEFLVDQPLPAPTSLVRMTSDEYFAGLSSSPFGDLPTDLAYIDGMHHLENALMDFINIESYCQTSSVVMFDDVLPRSTEEASRERQTQEWTGDVFRVGAVLKRYRPDLTLTVVATDPTGTLMVTNLDPNNRSLAGSFEDITRDYVQPDPQPVPRQVLERRGAVAPAKVLASALWDELRAGRTPQSAMVTSAGNARPRRANRGDQSRSTVVSKIRR